MKTKTILQAVFTATSTAFLCSCACVDYGRAQESLAFRIDPTPPDGVLSATCTTRVGAQDLTSSNGVYMANLPPARWGNMRLFGVIRVSGERHPEESETIIIKRDSEIAKKITVAEVRRLPEGKDGVFSVRLK